jgi:hypothetical protein
MAHLPLKKIIIHSHKSLNGLFLKKLIPFTICVGSDILAHGRWFSPVSPASSTTKTGRHDIAEILLKVALNTINQIKSNHD